MEIRTSPRPFCPLCASQGHLLYNDLQDYLYNAPGKWQMRTCTDADCGMCWLDPVAVDSDIGFLYENYYTHSESPSICGFKSKARAFLLNAYECAKLLPSSMLGLNSETQLFPLMFLQDLPPGRVLDVGCGAGHFLSRMHKLGWSVTGLDFDAKAIASAKASFGFDFLHTDLAGAQFPEDSFDAITMNHVIEHVPEPVKLLSESWRVLKPGGRLVATTPNIQSFGHSLFKDCWRGLEPPRHLQIFSLPALSNCAHKAAFKKVQVRSSAAHADIIIGASFGIREAKMNMTCSQASREINVLRALRSCFLQYRESWLLRSKVNCGEEAILICEK